MSTVTVQAPPATFSEDNDIDRYENEAAEAATERAHKFVAYDYD